MFLRCFRSSACRSRTLIRSCPPISCEENLFAPRRIRRCVSTLRATSCRKGSRLSPRFAPAWSRCLRPRVCGWRSRGLPHRISASCRTKGRSCSSTVRDHRSREACGCSCRGSCSPISGSRSSPGRIIRRSLTCGWRTRRRISFSLGSSRKTCPKQSRWGGRLAVFIFFCAKI